METTPTTLNLRPPLWLPIVFGLILSIAYVTGKFIEATFPASAEPVTISVQGEGKVSAAPDIAELRFGVLTGRVKSAAAAKKILTDKMTAILAAAKSAGVAEKDIQTESLWLQPAYDWNDGTQVPRGFEGSQNLVVKVRDLEKTGDILSAAIEAGANQSGGVNFTIDEPEKLRAEARSKAIRQAQEKAKALAKQLGHSLGKIRSFNEGGYGGGPRPYLRSDMAVGAAMMEETTLPIPTGEQEIIVTVNIIYDLD